MTQSFTTAPSGPASKAMVSPELVTGGATAVTNTMTGSEKFAADCKATAAAVAQLKTLERWSDASAAQAAQVWAAMPGNATDTLNALVKNGPLWDGDVPSKTGRDCLVDWGLATRGIVVKGDMGYQAATGMGLEVWRAGHPKAGD